MKVRKKPVFFMLLFTGIILFLVLLMQPFTILKFRDYIAVLFPKGTIALEQLHLLLILQALMLLVIIPVYILTFIFSWKYRADNPHGKYDPDLVDNRLAEYIWWGVPTIMTLIACVLTWVKTSQLDPFKPIETNKKEMTIQVVALQWKWLFIYPEEKIATVNFVQFPKETPIRFEITADAPMNSFWIPYLGGQIYAMPNMRTELHLVANEVGDFRGSSANLSGEGFALMNFITRASSEEDYLHWIESAKNSTKSLNLEKYNKLAIPSSDNPVEVYQLEDKNLFAQIMMKYKPQKE
ncbi:MAG TPA: COX aromatic rich motif-containing protein [Waddliaceae bacterium]